LELFADEFKEQHKEEYHVASKEPLEPSEILKGSIKDIIDHKHDRMIKELNRRKVRYGVTS
jgi:hypothetical protein